MTPKRKWHQIEEWALVLILLTMMGLSFVNVILRNWFNSAIIWGLEATSYLFAWLVLLGLGYLVRTHAHLGVDALINILKSPLRRALALFVALLSILYALLLFKGAYDFVANYYNLPATEGRLIPTGFEEMATHDFKGYVSVFDIPMPGFLRPFMEPVFLLPEDPPYRKLPVNIPYLALFFGVLWMLIRFAIALGEIWRGATDRLIASHEVEEALEAPTPPPAER